MDVLDLGRFSIDRDAGTDAGAPTDGGRDAGIDGGGNADADACVPLTYYLDLDGDSYGDPATGVESCIPIQGRVTNGDDCDDGSAAIRPGVTETCDDVDQDCDGAVDEGLMRPLGDPIEIDTTECCLGYDIAVAASDDGFLVAFIRRSEDNLLVWYLPASGPPLNPPRPGPMRLHPDGAREVHVVTVQSATLPPTALVTWFEYRYLRAQVYPFDGTPPLSPVLVTDDARVNGRPRPAMLGNQVVLAWTSAAVENVVGTRLFDPVLNEPADTIHFTVFPEVTRVYGGYSLVPLSETTSSVLMMPTLVSSSADGVEIISQLGVLDVTRDDGWDAARALSMPEMLGGLMVATQAEAGAPNAIGLFFSPMGTCIASVTAPPEHGSKPPTVGPCMPVPYAPHDLTIRGALVETLLERDSRFSLLEYRLDATPTGPLVDVAVRSTILGEARLAFAGNTGLVVYEDQPTMDTVSLRAQRIGCEP